ncbi:MAG: oxidoreductase, partial [Paenibacillus sp.]|nr:oxidoreductase [Paenibacillus sp.]
MPLRFVVAGTGWVAGEYWKAIAACRDAELYGVFSANAEHAQARMTEQGVEALLFTRFEDAVQDPNVDAVVLCSMPDVRMEQAILAAKHGKHLVIEKPVAMNRMELWSMAQALEKYP